MGLKIGYIYMDVFIFINNSFFLNYHCIRIVHCLKVRDSIFTYISQTAALFHLHTHTVHNITTHIYIIYF